MFINVDGYMISAGSNGPGRRLVLWLQGCTLACKGCFNKHLWPHHPNKLLETKDLSDFLLAKIKEYDCEGLTLSGGEPFQQAKASGLLVEKIKDENYTVVIYTGYTHNELKNSNNDYVKRLLEFTDILISGRYQGSSAEIKSWNENKDKEIIYLSELRKEILEEVNVEFIFTGDTLLITGFPEKNELQNIKELGRSYFLELG